MILKTPRPQLIGRKLSTCVAPHCQDRWHLARRDLIEDQRRMDLTLGSCRPTEARSTSNRGYVRPRSQPPPTRPISRLIDVTELRRTSAHCRLPWRRQPGEERERRKLAAISRRRRPTALAGVAQAARFADPERRSRRPDGRAGGSARGDSPSDLLTELSAEPSAASRCRADRGRPWLAEDRRPAMVSP